jgi:CBS domain-containing protein
VPVVDAHDRVVGVLTDRDIVIRAIAEGKSHRTRVGALMSRDLVTCGPEDDVTEAERKMSRARKSRAIVVDGGGRAVGVISLSNLAQVEEPERTASVLRAVTEREAPGVF